jgi:hypothetical protein
MDVKDAIIEICCDDWIVIYTNGELRAEGHSIRNEELIKIGQENSNAKHLNFYLDSDTQEEFDLYEFPKSLFEIPVEVFNS